MKNVVYYYLVTAGTFYEQAIPLFQEMMNSCSTKVQFDDLSDVIINQNMKHIAAKGINSVYDRSKGIDCFGEDKTSQRNINRHRFTHKRKSKK